MSSRPRSVTVLLTAILLCLASFAARAQTATVAPAPVGAVRGHITDPTGALIPGAQITVTTTKGAPAGKATTDAAGAYLVRGLASGSYVIQVDSQGFASFVSRPIPLEAGQTENVDIKMAVETTQQDVEVTADSGPTVSTDPDSNASAVILKGKDLDALSDDPDELSNELSALAGPSAGPNGGQIYIDGFTGGQLPPKSAIREIRINQNPFSAEFDRLGYGRIEILTKPGTDTLHGRLFMLGNDDAFNTGNPFTKDIPAYHSIQSNGTLSGAMSKNSSFFLSVEQRDRQDASIYTADTALLSGTTWVPGIVSGGLFAPQSRIAVSPRFDFQLGQKNTLSVRYQLWRNHESGEIGNTSLPSQDAIAQTLENTVQLDDTQVLSDHVVNETRFEYRRSTDWQTPASTAPTVTLPGYFSGGGNGGQSSSGHAEHFELQNFVTMAAGTHALKFGTWIRDDRQATSTSSDFNGAFSFATLDAYLFTLNHLNEIGTTQFNTDCETAQATDSELAAGCLPNSLTYVTGPYAFVGNLYDGALFIQDDWKYNRFLTLSGGLRFETQNHVADHADFAPRLAFAYALDGHKNAKQAKTVVRGGLGFFYDRFESDNLMNLEQYNGTARSQATTVIRNPTCFDPNGLSNIDGGNPANLPAACGSPSSVAPQIDSITPRYRSPYAEQAGISVERQLTRVSTLTFTYLHSFGVHQMVVRNANAFLPGSYEYGSSTLTGVRPTSYPGIIDQYFPEAVYKQNQIIVNINGQITHSFGMSGFFNWTDAKSDGGDGSNPSNSYNLSQDYGRASFVRPRFVFLMANYSAPWGVSFNPFLVAEAGRPYNIKSSLDLTGDNFFNDRPTYATADSYPDSVAQTSFGALDNSAPSTEALIPSNLATGPSAVTFNLRVSRSFGIGPAVESSGGPPHGGFGGPGGPGGGMRGGGRGGFGGSFGGGGGGFHGGMSNTGRKYSLTFSVQALNLFNDIDYGTPSGTVIPTPDGTGVNGPGSRFGVATQLAGGMFASPTNSAARRIFLQAFFSF